MSGPKLRAAALALVGFAVGGCNWYYNDVPSPDDLMHLIPWFDAMIVQRSVHPYERADVPRNSVPGTVPVGGGEADLSSEWGTGKSDRADRLVNPSDPETTLAVGDTLYLHYCAVCHGTAGAGDGLVGRKMGAPSILTDRARGFSDGYLYSIIRYGRGVMPRYGDKIRGVQRWAVVNYVRKLQGDASAPPNVPQTPGQRGAE